VRDSAKVRSDSHWYESPVNFPEFDEERAMTQVKSDGYCLVEPTLASAEVDEVRDSGKVRSDGHWYESPIDFLNFGEERARTKVRSASWRRFLGEKYVSEN
jgi:hypothetical protein